jgi:hypothetical protein
MTTQPKALTLSDWLERGNYDHDDVMKAAAELRRFHSVNQGLRSVNQELLKFWGAQAPAGDPAGESSAAVASAPHPRAAPSIDAATAQQALEALEMFDSYVEPLTQKFGGPQVPAEASTAWYVHRARDALRAALEKPDKCEWVQTDEDSDTWMASCGRHRYFSLNEGTPKDNHMKHCCYCGKPLAETLFELEKSHG